jgi:hypothetical protein
MADVGESTKLYVINNFAGIQRSTNRFLQKDSDLEVAENVSFSSKIGAIGKKSGYSQEGSDLTSTTSTSTSTSTTTSTSSSSSTSTSTTTT